MPQDLRQRTLVGLDGDDAAKGETSSAPASADPSPCARDSCPSPDDLGGKSVYVVDAHALIFQVFHALPEMTSPQGQPVNAVFGFTRDMFFLLEEKKPDYLFCAFDAPGPTFRHEIFADYKIQREEMPEELRPQIGHIRRILDALGIPILERESYEADDVVATVTRIVESLGGECSIVTSDKDCRQLLSDRVRMFNIRKDKVFDTDTLMEEWGIRPDQVVDYQTLVGDPVDNVPGVPLIGPKTAGELLRRYETLENIFEHANELSGKRRKQNLIDGRDQALVSRRLVQLNGEVPLSIDWEAGRVTPVEAQPARDLFREFGFRSFADKLGDVGPAEESAPWHAQYHAVVTPEQLAELVAQLARQPQISVDTETTGLNPRRASMVGLSLAWREGEAYYIPVRAPEGEPCLALEPTLEALRGILEDPSIQKIGQNLKFDMVVLRSAGIQLRGSAFDTMVASYLLDAGGRNHSLDDLARQYLQHQNIKIGELIGTGKNQRRMDEVPVDQITSYAAEDADVPLRLVPMLRSRLAEADLVPLFESLEMPLVEVLAELEYNGIRVDVARLQELSRRFGQQMDRLEQRIYEQAGRTFNIASPKQLADVLFHQLGLPVLKRTKTGPSTDAEVLEQLASMHELPATIIEYRQYAKLKSTYVDALPTLVHPETGRIHTSFNQVVAATGRLSSAEPNLQNIPIRTQTGREIRSAFLPGEEDWRLVAADYSQIELRVLAHFSGDEALMTAFQEDQDIHARVASEVYGVPLDDVTPDMRRRAKAINFGVIYGQSPFGLAKSLGIEKSEAAEFIDAYFGRYPGVDGFFQKILVGCRRTGYVSTISGRRRAVQGVRDPSRRGDSRQRNLPERTAINTVIQGSAADLIKQAMINVHRRLRREAFLARMLLQIHDELVFEVPATEVGRLSELVIDEMAGVGELSVPLKVDVKFGCNWAECESIT